MQKRMILALCLVILFLPNIRASDDLVARIDGIYENISERYEINGEITFVFKDLKVGSAEARRYPFGEYKIFLDPRFLENVTDDELKGLLAHELAHLESYSEMSFPGFLVFAIRYGLSDGYKTEIERETDMKAIEKGFGKELLAFREYGLRTGNEKEIGLTKKNYLSPDEIRDLLE